MLKFDLMFIAILVIFLIVSGFHGIVFVLKGIVDSYQSLFSQGFSKMTILDIVGQLFLLMFCCIGIYHVVFIMIPAALSKLFA